MHWNKSTRFALYAAVEMAQAGEGLVTAAEVATKYNVSVNHLAKVLQQLSRVGLADAVRGAKGGYRLACNPRELRLAEIIGVFERSLVPEQQGCVLRDSASACQQHAGCRVRRIFEELEEQAYFTLQSITLATLAGLPDRSHGAVPRSDGEG